MMQKMMNRKNKKGFTLIELIVVIAIIAILAVIAIPRLAGFTDKAKVKADVATAVTIGHAAAVYLVDNTVSATTLPVATLTNANLLNTVAKPQTATGANDWVINISGNTVTSVTTGGTIQLWP